MGTERLKDARAKITTMAKQIATNITWHESAVTREQRQSSLAHKGVTVWMTGLPSSGKSTTAVAVDHL